MQIKNKDSSKWVVKSSPRQTEARRWSLHLPPLPSPPPPHPVVLVNIVWVIMVVHPPPTFASLVAADLASTAPIPNLVDVPAPSTTAPTAAAAALTIIMLVVKCTRETVSSEDTAPQQSPGQSDPAADALWRAVADDPRDILHHPLDLVWVRPADTPHPPRLRASRPRGPILKVTPPLCPPAPHPCAPGAGRSIRVDRPAGTIEAIGEDLNLFLAPRFRPVGLRKLVSVPPDHGTIGTGVGIAPTLAEAAASRHNGAIIIVCCAVLVVYVLA